MKKKKKNFFVELFMDDNDINEKSIVGFFAFLMMVVTLGVDIYTGMKGTKMPINEFVFDGFLVMALGAFGIASVDKWIVSKKNNNQDSTINENETVE